MKIVKRKQLYLKKTLCINQYEEIEADCPCTAINANVNAVENVVKAG